MIYTDEEKTNIIKKFNEGDSIKAVCNKYGVSRSTLYRWTHDGRESTTNPENSQSYSAKDYNLLQHRMEKLENMITILKTVNCTVHFPLKEKLPELELLYGQYDAYTMQSISDFARHILQPYSA